MMGRLLRGKEKDPSCPCPARNTRKTKAAAKTDISGSKKSENKPLIKESNQNNLNSQSIITVAEIIENVPNNNCNKSSVENTTDDSSVSTSASIDSNSTCSARSNNKNEIISRKTSVLRSTRSKTDQKNNTILNFDQEKNEAISRPVLCDKTNSVVKNNVLERSQKAKNKVHFSSVNNIRRITQRRISDFFHSEEHHHKIKEFPELRSHERSTNDISVLNESIEKLDKSVNQKINEKKACSGADLSKTIIPDHIPVYKVPVVNGRESFRLTPPQVKNKEALYDFEVDENEEPRGKKKKRRPVKTYRKRKRPCFGNNVNKNNELDSIPQRTIILRNDPLVTKNCDKKTNADVIEICAPDAEIEKSDLQVHVDVHSKTKRATSQNKSFDRCNLSGAKSNSNSSNKLVCGDLSVMKHGGSFCAPSDSDKLSTKQNEECNLIHDTNVISSVGRSSRVNSLAFNSSASRCCTASHPKPNSSAHCISSDSLIGSDVQNQKIVGSDSLMDGSKLINGVSNYTYSSHSPLPEYSRLSEGIHVGPTYNCNSNSVNCSESEFNSTFLRGITASTPFRTHQSPVKKNYCQVRLSGGEASNKFRDRISIVSDSDSEEEFFGFRVNENHDDSINNINLNKTPQKAVESLNNEPVLKISIQEVIGILKKNVGIDKKQAIKKTKPSTVVFNNSSLLSPVSDKSEESYISSSDISFSHDKSQPNIDKFVTKDKRKDYLCAEEPDYSFSKPPRRSYSITPRKKQVVNYHELNDGPEVNSDDETNAKKKVVKKTRKYQPSKKESKEMEKLAAMMNSQFQEVDKFELLVE